MDNEISEEFEVILNEIDELNQEQREAMKNGDTAKVKEIEKQIDWRLGILIAPQ